MKPATDGIRPIYDKSDIRPGAAVPLLSLVPVEHEPGTPIRHDGKPGVAGAGRKEERGGC